MSYTKPDLSIADLAAAVAAALAQNSVKIDGLAQALADAGGVVQLETGDIVWVSCVVHDLPETLQIDFLTVALACTSTGQARTKPNGQIVAQVFWSGVLPTPLASLGIDTVRRALMMVALGEPQPQVPISIPAEGGPTEQDAVPIDTPEAHSIRLAIKAANELAAPLADVL